ncbi:MAG: Xaa-Pro aminopeptidase, partial [Bacteroidota bacterium]
MKKLLLLALSISFIPLSAQMPKILDLKERGEVRDEWLKGRIETVLPGIMRREGIDMWILLAREYNEDPVLKTMLPSNWLSARRTTMLIIYDNGEKLETLACARYDVGEVFKKAWDKESQPDQWARLNEIIKERDPKKIAINKSEHFALANGITAYHHDKFMGGLDAKYKERVVSG